MSQVQTKPGTTNSSAFWAMEISSMKAAVLYKRKEKGQIEDTDGSKLESVWPEGNHTQFSQARQPICVPWTRHWWTSLLHTQNVSFLYALWQYLLFLLVFLQTSKKSSLVWWQPKASSCWPTIAKLQLPTLLVPVSAGHEGNYSLTSMFLPHFHSLWAYGQQQAWGLKETPGAEARAYANLQGL